MLGSLLISGHECCRIGGLSVLLPEGPGVIFRAASALWILLSSAVAPLQAASEEQERADKRLLFLTHAGLYKHASLGPAEQAVAELGVDGEFDVTTLAGYKQPTGDLDLAIITAEYLAQFDGLMMITNGNLPLAASQMIATKSASRDSMPPTRAMSIATSRVRLDSDESFSTSLR